MTRFISIVIAGALFGGLSSYALLPFLAGDNTKQVGIGGVSVQVEADVYSHQQLLVGIFVASACGSAIACGMAWGLAKSRRKGRR